MKYEINLFVFLIFGLCQISNLIFMMKFNCLINTNLYFFSSSVNINIIYRMEIKGVFKKRKSNYFLIL